MPKLYMFDGDLEVTVDCDGDITKAEVYVPSLDIWLECTKTVRDNGLLVLKIDRELDSYERAYKKAE